jgi:hypothetical protein
MKSYKAVFLIQEVLFRKIVGGFRNVLGFDF